MNIFRNTFLVIKDQMPLSRFIRNFFLTRNAWGLFYKSSHISQGTNLPKVKYNTKKSADKAALAMMRKQNVWFSNYKCLRCDGYHVGKTRRREIENDPNRSNQPPV